MPAKQTTILIVDDSADTRDTLAAFLQKDYTLLKAHNANEANQLMSGHEVHIVLLDIRLPDVDGLDVLVNIKSKFPEIEVVMISGLKGIKTAVKAMQMGAYHYLPKPFDIIEVRSVVKNVVKHQKNGRELLFLRSEIKRYLSTNFIIGQSRKMIEISGLIDKIALLPITVLIQGESGTGKEVLARYIYNQDKRGSTPFIPLDLGSLPTGMIESILFGYEKGAFTGAIRQHIGKFEMANGGTLFLDEICNLSHEGQGKLLRAIQEGEIERIGSSKPIRVKVRVIAATNIDLQEAVKKGAFRGDLYYRLNVVPIKLPPLRERTGDFPELIGFFLKRYNKRFHKTIRKFSSSAIEVLSSSYDWPGNIRELENLIERLVAIVEGDIILKEHIPVEYRLGDLQKRHPEVGLLNNALEIFEQKFILKTLEEKKWHRKATATALGVPLSTLKYKIKKLGLVSTRDVTNL